MTLVESRGGEEFSQEWCELNREEIEKLRYFLGILKKPTSGVGTCSLAFSGNSQPYALNVSISKGPWVVDFGATNHINQSSHGFVSYSPCSSKKNLAIANGTMVIVAGQGDVVINQNLVLKNVLHVPKLSTNLVSIHKLTKDLNFMVTSSFALCKFQDRTTGTMIGLAWANPTKEQLEQFYRFILKNSQNIPFANLAQSGNFSTTLSTKYLKFDS